MRQTTTPPPALNRAQRRSKQYKKLTTEEAKAKLRLMLADARQRANASKKTEQPK